MPVGEAHAQHVVFYFRRAAKRREAVGNPPRLGFETYFEALVVNLLEVEGVQKFDVAWNELLQDMAEALKGAK